MIEAERARTIDAERMTRPIRISQEVFFKTRKRAHTKHHCSRYAENRIHVPNHLCRARQR